MKERTQSALLSTHAKTAKLPGRALAIISGMFRSDCKMAIVALGHTHRMALAQRAALKHLRTAPVAVDAMAVLLHQCTHGRARRKSFISPPGSIRNGGLLSTQRVENLLAIFLWLRNGTWFCCKVGKSFLGYAWPAISRLFYSKRVTRRLSYCKLRLFACRGRHKKLLAKLNGRRLLSVDRNFREGSKPRRGTRGALDIFASCGEG